MHEEDASRRMDAETEKGFASSSVRRSRSSAGRAPVAVISHLARINVLPNRAGEARIRKRIKLWQSKLLKTDRRVEVIVQTRHWVSLVLGLPGATSSDQHAGDKRVEKVARWMRESNTKNFL